MTNIRTLAVFCCIFLLWTVKAASIIQGEPHEPEFTDWPTGRYALLMHEDGCPDNASFEEGYKQFDTEEVNTFNLWPLGGGLKGTSIGKAMVFHYCSKSYLEGNYSWPSGTYCLHRMGDQCPKGFDNGFMFFDEEDSNTQHSAGGTRPAGEYGRNTKQFFCCRHDRSPERAIQLPNTHAFYLYPHRGQVCQEVLGMSSRLQRVLIDTEDKDNTDSTDGSHPESVLNKVGTLIYICRYTPGPHLNVSPENRSTRSPMVLKEDRELVVRKEWPRGRFGIPMAGEQCPDFFNFTRSYLYQDTEDSQNKNLWPKDVAMKGPIKSEGYRIHYCSKFVDSGHYNWPAGDYCIHRVSGVCPSGFTNGSVHFDDENTQNANDRKGELPDGVFDSDTLLYFCCRNDSPASSEISLPNNKPFYLYRHKGDCQAVVNMTVTVQIIKWDDENINNTDMRTGSSPAGFIDSIGISLYFCLYKPKELLTSSNSWPRGRFALCMTENKTCPEFFSFEKGYFYHSVPTSGAATTVYGPDIHRYGRIETGIFEGGFCSKNVDVGTYDWPAGRYCINRVGQECPEGFQNGSVYIDNGKLNNIVEGFLPAGSFDMGTMMHFCCKMDGDYNTAVELPTTTPFILWIPYMNIDHDYNCQAVDGMFGGPTIIQIAVNSDGSSEAKGLSPGNLSREVIYMVYCLYK